MKPAVLLLSALLVGAVVLAGCGSNSYDSGTVEKYLRKSQEGKVRGLALGDATLPEGRRADRGRDVPVHARDRR